MKVMLNVLAFLLLLVSGIALRNWRMNKKLTEDWMTISKSLHRLPLGFEVVTDENGDHAGYFIWLLGPYEYRDSKTGELMWTE